MEIVDFSSTCDVGSRLLKPLLIRALGAEIYVADPDMHWIDSSPSFRRWGLRCAEAFRPSKSMTYGADLNLRIVTSLPS